MLVEEGVLRRIRSVLRVSVGETDTFFIRRPFRNWKRFTRTYFRAVFVQFVYTDFDFSSTTLARFDN